VVPYTTTSILHRNQTANSSTGISLSVVRVLFTHYLQILGGSE
jgi:hypothetical protein